MADDENFPLTRVIASSGMPMSFAAWDDNSWDVAAQLVAQRSRFLGAATTAGEGGMISAADAVAPVTVVMNLQEEPDTASMRGTAATAANAQFLLQAVVVPGEKTHEGQIIEAVTVPWFDIIEAILKDPKTAFEISPRKWEEIVAGAYHRAGFDEITLTPPSGDGGRDVIAVKKGLGVVRIIDQVKAFGPTHLVSANDVRALMGVLHCDGASKGFLTTTSDFAPLLRTDPLISPLIPQRLGLVDGKMLVGRLRDLTKK
jgi:restriction system protein